MVGLVVVGQVTSGTGAAGRRGRFLVEVATAIKKTVPVRIEALCSVTPIASREIKSRIDTEIVGVHFSDQRRGAR